MPRKFYTNASGTSKSIQVNMDSLLNLQYSLNETIAHLKQVFDNINLHFLCLESLRAKKENYGSLLIMIIIKRMPKDIALQVSSETKSDIWSMKDILEIILKEIEARETCEFVGEKEKSSCVQTKIKPRNYFFISCEGKVECDEWELLL